MTESGNEKTTVWIPIPYKQKLKGLANDNNSTIEIEIEKVLKEKFPEVEV